MYYILLRYFCFNAFTHYVNRFLIGFKSGDLARITCIFAPIEYTNTYIPASTALRFDVLVNHLYLNQLHVKFVKNAEVNFRLGDI